MPVPSQGHYGFHSFRLLTDFVCLRVSTYCTGDHYPVSCSAKYGKSNKRKPRVNKHTVIRYRNLKNFDEKLFLRDLKNQNFNLVLQITDPDLALDS
jgi:Fe2+ or Zn2+ uptake regulation protein